MREEFQAEALTCNLGVFLRFLDVAARQNGQITSVAAIARDAQVARQTVQGYFDILVDTLLGFWLSAWKLRGATKQLAHPKFSVVDAGMVRAFQGRVRLSVEEAERGFLLETFLLHELRAYLAYRSLYDGLAFWSSADGVEADVVLETAQG